MRYKWLFEALVFWWAGPLQGRVSTTATAPVSVWLAYEAADPVAVQGFLPSSLWVADVALTRRMDEKKKKYLFFHYSAARLDILTAARKRSKTTLVLLESLPSRGFRYRSSRNALPVPLSKEMVEAHGGKESVVVPLDAVVPVGGVPWASLRGKHPVIAYYHPNKTKPPKARSLFDEFAHSNPYILYE
jgi:hypothetical protein